MTEDTGTTIEQRGVIDRFEGRFAVLKMEGGQELKWPINNLPNSAKEGTAIRVKLSTSKTDEEERRKTAKTILNELLKSDP